MKLSEGEKKVFPKPSVGLVQAVCYATWDIGLQKAHYNGEEKIYPKIIVAWEINELIPIGEYEGKRFVSTKKYTALLGETARLRKDLMGWLGRDLTETELKEFESESLIGQNCMLNLVSNESEGKTYINIASISPLMRGLTPMVPENKPLPAPKWVDELIKNQVHADEAIPF